MNSSTTAASVIALHLFLSGAANAAASVSSQVGINGLTIEESLVPGKVLQAEGTSYAIGRPNGSPNDEIVGFVTAKAKAVSDFGINRVVATDAHLRVAYDAQGNQAGAEAWSHADSRWNDTWRVAGPEGAVTAITISGHVEYGIAISGPPQAYDYNAGIGPLVQLDVYASGGFRRVIEGPEFLASSNSPGSGPETSRISWSYTFNVASGSSFEVGSNFAVFPGVAPGGVGCTEADCRGGFIFDSEHTASWDVIELGTGFTLLAESGNLRSLGGGSYGYVSSVPEPSTLCALLTGGVLLFVRARLNQTRPAGT